MKILFLTENFPPETNAAATRVYERACYWVRSGHEVTIITCAPNFPGGSVFSGYRNRWRQTEIMSQIRVVRVKTFITPNQGVLLRTLDFLSFMFMAIVVGIFEKKPDIVAATSPQFFAALGGWLLASLRRIPFVFELGDLWPASIVAVGVMKKNFLLSLMESMELCLYRRSAAIVVLTHSFKSNLISRGIKEDKIAVVINGVDIYRYRPIKRDQSLAAKYSLNNHFTVGYVGTHGLAHALHNVLNAASLLRDQNHIRFLLVGPGAMRESLIAEAKLRDLDNVIFIPPQPKSRMPQVWSLCDVALIHLRDDPVFSEVIPSKIFEAMAMGLPLMVAVPKGEATAIVESHSAGLIIPPEEPKALAAAVRNLAQEPKSMASLSAASLTAAPFHSREIQAALMMTVLEAVLIGEGARAAQHLAAATLENNSVPLNKPPVT